jgi:prepilin-type processing-associated H-X9-DG protein
MRPALSAAIYRRFLSSRSDRCSAMRTIWIINGTAFQRGTTAERRLPRLPGRPFADKSAEQRAATDSRLWGPRAGVFWRLPALPPRAHREWADGNTHATGFSTAWPPNKVTLGQPAQDVDIDLNGINGEDGGPTFAAITSRSYHPTGVNVLLADGSGRFISEQIDGFVWRALGTAAGGEAMTNGAF